jgi:hypothetical protein
LLKLETVANWSQEGLQMEEEVGLVDASIPVQEEQ